MPWWVWALLLAMVAALFVISVKHRQPTISGAALAGTGRVLSLESSYGGSGGDVATSCKIGLRVEVPGSAPYDVTILRNVPHLHLPRVQPGATVQVHVDPSDPRKVRIDFDGPPANRTGT